MKLSAIFKKFLNKKTNKTQVFEISLDRMQEMFVKTKKEAGWDMNEKMYWGYYFLDQDVNNLKRFSDKLKELNLHVVEMRKTDRNDLFLVRAEEHAVHTAKSLFDQCNRLAELSINNNIEVFDGWDVEKVNLNKGLVQ